MSVIMDDKGSDPMENLKKKPTKSILKSSSSFEVPDGPSGSNRRASRSKEPKGTKWDEMNILETLHPPGKDYGHMKIDEPKTPYERTVSEDAVDTLDPNVLADKIVESCKKDSKDFSRGVSLSSDSDEELTPEEKEKKKEFEKRRKAHYNEFLMAKKAMKELHDEDEDEEKE